MFPWFSGRTIDLNLQFYWSQVWILVEAVIFSYNFLLEANVCSWKCPGPAAANFELMINSHMMNRVKGYQNKSLICSLRFEILLNFIWSTKKFHHCHHANLHEAKFLLDLDIHKMVCHRYLSTYREGVLVHLQHKK